MPGLFIQRQAESLTPFCDVAVIYVHPDPDCPNKYEVEFSEENEVRVLRVYYKVKGQSTTFMGKAHGWWKFYRANMKAIHSIRQFSPDLVHAHVLTRMGLIAWKVCRSHRIPLVISEHWSRYFPQNNSYHGWLRRWGTSRVVGKASLVIAVSEPLKSAMQQCQLINQNFQIIPNVVDTLTFKPIPVFSEHPIKTIVHISCFEDKSKNISGFLEAIKELSMKRSDFQCLLVGAGPDWDSLKSYAGSLGIIDKFAFFTGLKTGVDLVKIIQEADFTVVSSHYETFGTVVIESLSCGIPVVATRVGIAQAVINEKNGMLVPPGDKEAMIFALYAMIERCRDYDKMEIHADVSDKFSKETIGRQLADLYRPLIPERNLTQ
jgi:glycosyltransferase involved in cell wall biosynthesis